MPHFPPATQALILINTAIFCLNIALEGLLTRWFALYPLGFGFLPWQLGTYAFLHDNFSHLFFNMLGVWMFGAELERLWGPKRFLQLFAASVLSAAALQMGLVWSLGSLAPTVGASGGLFGFLLAYAMLFPNRIIVPLIPPIPMKAKVFAAIFGGLELLLGVSNPASGVAHFAHLGGMLGAFILIKYWRKKSPFGRY
ncbi:MAG: rhomboid family intramembrane serine protease [Burkholderiales bacterium]|jgi:membrane associated rhomboid family serine protease